MIAHCSALDAITCEWAWLILLVCCMRCPGKAIKIVLKAVPPELPNKAKQAERDKNKGDCNVCYLRAPRVPCLQQS